MDFITTSTKYFLIIYIFSFNFLFSKQVEENYLYYVNEIIEDLNRSLEKDYGLFCCGTGGELARNVSLLQIQYKYYGKGSLDNARFLEVIATEKFLDKINHHEKIRPFLKEYPFPKERTVISISFNNENGEYSPNNEISFSYQVKGLIHYFKHDFIKDDLIEVELENYEESRQIVKNKSS